MKALILAPFPQPLLERLKAKVETVYESWADTRRLLPPEELIERIQKDDISILVIEADFIFDEVFDNTDRLRFIGVCRSAVDHVDLDAATRHGVLVVNTPGRNAISVAELTIGLMLSLARHIPTAHHLIKSGNWDDPVGPYLSLRGTELANKVAGIVGFGAIGSQVAKRLAAFDMKVLAYDPYASEKIARSGARPVDLPTLLEASDFVSIHCPASPETAGLIGARELGLMKPIAYLINTAGWEIVDEKLLLDALEQKHLAGAAFDIFQTHPLSLDSPLLKLDNVILTPHIGGATDGTVARYSQMIVEDMERFLDGKRPNNVVNPEVWK